MLAVEGGGGKGESSPRENEECTKGSSQQMDKDPFAMGAYNNEGSGW